MGVSCVNAATVFFDGTFNNADWNETKIVDSTNNGSFSAFQVASGGNPGSFRETNQSLNQGLLGVSHLRSMFACNPSTQGAITSIDVSYDLQEFAPLGGFEVVYGILAFQNNTYYIGPTENLNQSSWTSFSHHGLTEASFSDTFGASGPLGPNDEITHYTFLNAYLMSKGAAPANLEQFRTLPGSTATGSSGKPRLTNFMQLTLDTSWWTRYRSRVNNPDLDPNFVFPQAVPDLAKGQFTAIPRTDANLKPDEHIQAIANTAGFHMPTIEQGGNTLYPSMAQRASSAEVLRILISIGPTETMHF